MTTTPTAEQVKTPAPLWKKRLLCFLTLNHFRDPSVYLIGQRMFVCKKCKKVLP